MTQFWDKVYEALHRSNGFYTIVPSKHTLLETLRGEVLRAQKYELTDEVVEAATELSTKHPEVLLAMLPKARLTFPLVGIDWNQRVVLETLGQPVSDDAPFRTGVLLKQVTQPPDPPFYSMNEMGFNALEERPQVIVNPVAVIYSTELPIMPASPQLMEHRRQITEMTGFPGKVLDVTLLGTTFTTAHGLATHAPGLFIDLNKLSDDEREELDLERQNYCNNLLQYASHTWSKYWPPYRILWLKQRHPEVKEEIKRIVSRSVMEFSGTWRFIAAVTALLQNREITTYEQYVNPGRRRFVSGKSVQYLRHERVKLIVPRKIALRKSIESIGHSLQLPRFEVEGHWRSRHGVGDPRCEHPAWNHERRTIYRCVLCGWERWFVPSFMKGDAQIGFLTKERVVVREP
jgi:hypothetical protein